MYVYLIQSISEPKRRYVGMTADLTRRMEEHNQGECFSTHEHRPWKVVTFIKFASPKRAEEFEAYLKHGSGHTFAKRHLW